MTDYKLEIFEDKKGEFRWRRTASNGEIVGASSEGHKARKDCQANTNREASGDKWEFYKDKAEQSRWRCFSTHNGRRVCKSTEALLPPPMPRTMRG